MVRTHRPTGSVWTCASQLQQTRRYREVDVAGCTPPPARVLCPDSDDELSDGHRAAKRRKVEKLMIDFFDGRSLFIPSASASGPELRAVIRAASKDVTRSQDEHWRVQDDALWADEQDGWEILQAYAKRTRGNTKLQITRKSKGGPNKSGAAITRDASEPHAPAMEAVSSVRMKQQRQCPKLSAMPSEEALPKAAELRARNQSLEAEISDNITVHVPDAHPTVHSAPPAARPTSSFKWTEKTQWVYPQTPADETFADELRLSRTESPSRRPRAFFLPDLASASFSSNATVENTPGRAYGLGDSAPRPNHDSSPGPLKAARNEHRIEQNVTSMSEDRSSAEDTPTNTGSTAMELCTVQGSGWTTINGSAQTAPVGTSVAQSNLQSQPDPHLALVQRAATACGVKPETAATSSGKAKSARKSMSGLKGRKAAQTSSQNAVDRSVPQNQQQLMGAFRVAKSDYISAPASQSGTTPFQYRRKRKPQSATSKDSHGSEASPRPRIDAEKTACVAHLPPRPACGKIAQASFSLVQIPTTPASDASGVAQHTSVSLMNKHLNQTLPRSEGSVGRSSSLKKALRNEMRLSGAQLERAPGEPPSSQVTDEGDNVLAETRSTLPTGTGQNPLQERHSALLWPGTQVLLDRAQHDLFISPQKSSDEDAHDCGLGFVEDLGSIGQGAEHGRLPLRSLSQECAMPSTQAMMNEWSPWSTVKKPKAGKRATFAPSPLAEHGTTTPAGGPARSLRSAIAMSRENTAQTGQNKRRSSLRFSTSTAETPVPPPKSNLFSTSFLNDISLLDNTDDLDKSVYSLSTLRAQPPAPPEDTDLDFTTLSFAATTAQLEGEQEGNGTRNDENSTGEGVASFQEAQRQRDDPEQTLSDLASEFLSTADMQAAMSQN